MNNGLPLLEYPKSKNSEWDKIPLGINEEDETTTLDLSIVDNVSIAGNCGSGKSVLARNIIFHCIQHANRWELFGIDLERFEFEYYKKYTQVVTKIATSIIDSRNVFNTLERTMDQRYSDMRKTGVNNFKNLKDTSGKPLKAIMLIIDESFRVLAPSGIRTPEGLTEDRLIGENRDSLKRISRLGWAAGIHIVMSSQSPDSSYVEEELHENFNTRIVTGRASASLSERMLKSGAATHLPPRGINVISTLGNNEEFYGYFATQEWIDNWMAENFKQKPEED